MSASNVPCGVCSYDPTLKILGSWLVCLPFEAVSQNALKSNIRGVAGHKYRTTRDRFEKFLATETSNIPRASGRRRVFFTRYFAPPKRAFDRDNLIAGMKPLRDCLTRLGLIVDDSDKHMEGHYRQVKTTDSNAITLEIEDIAWPTQ